MNELRHFCTQLLLVYVYGCLPAYLCITCMQCPRRSEEALDPVELQLQVDVSHHVVLGTKKFSAKSSQHCSNH